MKKLTTYTSIFLAALLLAIACKKEKPELNVSDHDPCSCASEVSADFKIIELEDSPQFNPIGTETDTICRERGVFFRANEDNAEYTWYIGSEILNTQQVGRYFDNTWANQNIPITLVVRKDPNLTCFPNDDGYDSVVRYMHVYPRPIMIPQDTVYFTPTAGTYRVKGPHLVDSFDVTFWAVPSIGGFSYSYKIFNFDGLGSSCENPNADIGGFTFRQVWLDGVGFPCNYFRGDIHRKLNGVTEMNFRYSLDGTSSNIVERTYFGRKLN
jgi:hypothetical protein